MDWTIQFPVVFDTATTRKRTFLLTMALKGGGVYVQKKKGFGNTTVFLAWKNELIRSLQYVLLLGSLY